MNRVLSLPHTTLFPGLLSELQRSRLRTVVRPNGIVRFEPPGGVVEMRFARGQAPIAAGTEIYVWWKAGGFVCAPTADIDAEERRARRIEQRVAQAREALAAARADRALRESAYMDLQPPPQQQPEHAVVRC
jgi:hypothetical protein